MIKGGETGGSKMVNTLLFKLVFIFQFRQFRGQEANQVSPYVMWHILGHVRRVLLCPMPRRGGEAGLFSSAPFLERSKWAFSFSIPPGWVSTTKEHQEG